MRIIKLGAIDSTNTYLRQLSSAEQLEDFTVVIAEHQKKGKGQRGTSWRTQDSKNLTCSVFKDISFINPDEQFGISMVVSLAIIKALEFHNIPKLYIKWPNDILSENKKICGILIENVIKNNKLEASIIGIGLNVNQMKFQNLPNASSLLELTGRYFNVEELMDRIIKELKNIFKIFEKGRIHEIKEEYERQLFRKGKPSTFIDDKKHLFTGYIQGITSDGNLKILLEDDEIRDFDLKEVQLLY